MTYFRDFLSGFCWCLCGFLNIFVVGVVFWESYGGFCGVFEFDIDGIWDVIGFGGKSGGNLNF